MVMAFMFENVEGYPKAVELADKIADGIKSPSSQQKRPGVTPGARSEFA
jgi:hypothetical protein